MIHDVIKLSNGIVMVFDGKGEQLPEYRGCYEEVRDKILADAPPSANFFHFVWMVFSGEISREEW